MGVDATAAIRTPAVTAAVSKVAANSEVRAEMRARQQQWAAEHGGGVIEGRDIGSVVFPDAELKLYLTASPRTRAQRRVAEAGGDVDEIEAAIAARDHYDSNRADSPLTFADGSIVVDTTGSSIDEVLAQHCRTDVERDRRGVTKISTKFAGQSVPDKIAYHTVRTIVTVFCRVWCRMTHRGSRELSDERAVHPRAHAPQHHRHAGGVGRVPQADAVHGRRQVVEQQATSASCSRRSAAFRSAAAPPIVRR